MAAVSALLALKDGQPIPMAPYADFSHLSAAPRIADLRITIIDERDGFFYTVGSPLAYSSPVHSAAMWRLYRGFPTLNRPDVNFVRGTVVRVKPLNQTLVYQIHKGDSRSTEMRAYVDDAGNAARRLVAAKKSGIVIIGDGAVEIEFAGKLKSQYSMTRVTLIHARDHLLSKEPVPVEFKSRVLQLLREQGVNVILQERPIVEDLSDGTSYVKFDNGDRIHAAVVIMAVASISPSSGQQVTSGPSLFGRIYAAGDLVHITGIKLGGNAMVMGSVAAANIYSSLLSNPRRRTCPPFSAHMAISIGQSMALWRGGANSELYHGEALAESFFGHDLGWQRILNSLALEDYEHPRSENQGDSLRQE
ncbi:hypothetical protein AtubIFM55763_009999 [Aspergillus tubingensis]|nr:hypothetical protein AtubIFM55763_009999 [Aspergillus tubingensis]